MIGIGQTGETRGKELARSGRRPDGVLGNNNGALAIRLCRVEQANNKMDGPRESPESSRGKNWQLGLLTSTTGTNNLNNRHQPLRMHGEPERG